MTHQCERCDVPVEWTDIRCVFNPKDNEKQWLCPSCVQGIKDREEERQHPRLMALIRKAINDLS